MTVENFSITIAEVIEVRKSLADVLVEETGYLTTMQISKVEALQERKLKLTGLLERYTIYLGKNLHLVSGMSLADRDNMKKVNDYFNKAMRENYDKLLVARAINQTIVTCITRIFKNKSGNHAYNARGIMGGNRPVPVSVTLNRVV